MYLIVGLGNPGKEYENTRHNMGFKVLNKLAEKYNIPITKSKFNGKYGIGMIENEKVILLEPQSYMNLSGEGIKPMLDFYKVDPSNLLV
ncbi:MAG: aminoacyl-tRNA hydrolase, partial [Intestinibacter sp.]